MSPSNEYSRLISFRIDWFDLFVVQGLSRVLSYLYRSENRVILRVMLMIIIITPSPYCILKIC